MKCILKRILFLAVLNCFFLDVGAQVIPAQTIIKPHELTEYLKEAERAQIGDINQSNQQLAQYFRTKFSERFFYDYRTLDNRLSTYNQLYNNQAGHKIRALDHLGKYADSTQWVLPFNYLNGEAVNAYALRHLARQHKMVDIALYYFNDNKDPKYIQYFENQMRSLNVALEKGEYEKIEDGNGVYEVYRSGYRIFNWLWIHNMFLNESEYSDFDQLQTIATLLQHGQHLYERNDQFRSGNHQTKGMSALAVLSILFRDFQGTDKWYERAMLRLSEHLNKEINPDGFQFERSVHYHMSDINNYFYVYQLAKMNNIEVDKKWEEKLNTLFTTLTKIAYPDKSAPVLQDDTEIPWAEKNDISGAMTFGYLLFNNPEFGYFASDKVDERMYWYLNAHEVDELQNIEQTAPSYGSISFENTHYYIMREGWNTDDKMLIISAGLDNEKPDHQHGDMLGIQAIAHGQAILPNYQVRYSLKDFEHFKNSMVKNVALVDNELQGKKWTSNKGGSGFGKFKELPVPNVIAWESNEAFDLFIGSHDGFNNIDVNYSRQVIFVKNAFWIVKDNFTSENPHNYKQVWQGHYTSEVGPNLIRSTFDDATGCDILQLNQLDSVSTSGVRGKTQTVVSKLHERIFDFVTVVYPYHEYNNRIDELDPQLNIDEWIVNNSKWEFSESIPVALHKGSEHYFFGATEASFEHLRIQVSKKSDLYVKLANGKLKIQLLDDTQRDVTVFQSIASSNNRYSKTLTPGDHFTVVLE